MDKYSRIAVLMGGNSAEREVSLKSGQAVYSALIEKGLNAVAVDIKDKPIQSLNEHNFDIAFIALHGRGGEDGTIQALLELMGVPYTGSGVLASALGMDKHRCKMLWRSVDIMTPDYFAYDPAVDVMEQSTRLQFPVMVKPALEGSSIGITKVQHKEELIDAVERAKEYACEILVEEWVSGEEYTAAVLGNEVLPLIRLSTPEDFYDYDAKYTLSSTQYHCPCGLDRKMEENLSAQVLKAFSSLGATGWGRVDFIIDKHNQPWFLEINTSPGMTDHSLVPMAAAASGIGFKDLVVEILDIAWRERRGR